MSDETPLSEQGPRRSAASRRTFLRGAGLGAGATVLGAAVIAAGGDVAAALPAAPAQPEGHDAADAGSLSGSLVAHVSDVRTGRIVLLTDGGETVVTDPALARALARKAR